MFITNFGTFDGNSWESVCQICFKQKYGDEYSEVKASSPGDHGIEGFTRSGKVFQCYCPNDNYNSDKLYEEQRDKITKDLGKLKIFEKQIKSLLGDIKIKQWIFVTPKIDKNELIKHCTSKTTEFRRVLSEILDKDFEVLAQDAEFLLPHLQVALKEVSPKVLFAGAAADEDKINYKNTESSLVDNSNRKHRQRLENNNVSKIEQKVDNLTDKTIKNFLDGKEVLQNWYNVFPSEYERFIKIVSQVEEKVEEECLFTTSNYNERYKEIQEMLEEKLQNSFSDLDTIMVTDLANHVIADWILRCPLNFE
jgi:hypothetical protein